VFLPLDSTSGIRADGSWWWSAQMSKNVSAREEVYQCGRETFTWGRDW